MEVRRLDMSKTGAHGWGSDVNNFIGHYKTAPDGSIARSGPRVCIVTIEHGYKDLLDMTYTIVRSRSVHSCKASYYRVIGFSLLLYMENE